MKRKWHRCIIFSVPAVALFFLMMRPPASAVAIGILQTGTVLASNQRDAAVFPFAKTAQRDRAIEQFLNFVAAKNITRIEPANSYSNESQLKHSADTATDVQSVTQSAGSCEVTTIDQACSIWKDSSTGRSAIYLSSPYHLRSTLAHSGECLGFLKNTEHRILILRLDSEQNYLQKHPAVRVFDDISQVMAACGAERATIVFSNKQFSLCSALFQNMRKDDSPATDIATQLIVAKQLQAVTLTKEQVAPRNHESVE